VPLGAESKALRIDAEGDRQLLDLLGADHPLATGDGGRQAVEHRGLAGLGAAGNEDVEACAHTRLEGADSAGLHLRTRAPLTMTGDATRLR
jgi:hypothetical protein